MRARQSSGGAASTLAARTRSAFRPIKRLGRRLARAGRGDARDSMAVTGYPTVTSVVAGETLGLHLSSRRNGSKTLIVERVGRLSVQSELTGRLRRLDPPPERGWEGYDWPVTASFTIPADWPSGLYGVRHGRDALCSFVVRSPRPGTTSRVLVHVPFLTSAAYDPAGGKSLYGFNSQPDGSESARASVVSLHRPSAWDPLGYSQTVRLSSLAEWLDDEGIPVEYCSSVDLHSREDLLEHYDALVLPGHDEYWTRAMRDRVERFVSDGGNLIVLSGNTMYRQVRLDSDERLVAFYKYAGDDPWPRADEVTVAFADPPVNRPQNSLLGAGFTHGAIDGDTSAYDLRFPEHWVFEGLNGPAKTSPFMTYETDAAGYVDEADGYPRVTGDDGAPLACTVLASADLSSWVGKPGRATMTVFSRSGTVFNAGTTEWVDALQSDPVVHQVTRNVFARLGTRIAAEWEDIGTAPHVRALAAADGSLFAVLHDGTLVRRHPVGADVPWKPAGSGGRASFIATAGSRVYGVTADERVVRRDLSAVDDMWSECGECVADVRGLAAVGGLLYAIDAGGNASYTAASAQLAEWRRSPIAALAAGVGALTSLQGVLIACTDDGRLLRSSADHINEDSVWIEIGRCDGATGLATVEWMLFATTRDGRLLRLDLAGLRSPSVSA